MNKKGAFITGFVAFVVLLIIGFTILVSLFFSGAFSGRVDREACHQSVILKATIPNVPALEEAKEAVPLKCKTQRSCVTDKSLFKGECEDDLGDTYSTVRVESAGSERNIKVQEFQIDKFIAEEMSACWAMMGEGKVQIFDRDFEFGESTESACVICSRIAFDETIKEDRGEVSGLARYMANNNVPGQERSHWEFLTGRKSLGETLLGQGDALRLDRFDTDKEKAIVFIETSRTTNLPWIGAIGGGSAGAVGGAAIGFAVGSAVPVLGNAVGAGVGFVLGSVGAIAGGVGGYAGGDAINQALTDFEGDYSSSVFFVNTEDISKLGCDSIESIS